MAKSDNQHPRDDEGRFRRRDRVFDNVRDRPYTAASAAALATVAAGAAAYFLTRKSGDTPLMKWGQREADDSQKGAAAFKPQGETTRSDQLETSSTNPSSSAGLHAGSGASSPSSVKDDLSAKKPTDNKLAGLDKIADEQTKAGAIAY